MFLNEIICEAPTRRDFLRGMGAAAAVAAVPGLAKAGEYKDLVKVPVDAGELQKVWVPRMTELQKRADQLLAKLIRAAGPQWAQRLQGTQVKVVSNENYAQSDSDNRRITIDLTVFWDAPEDTLAFVIGHELGHIAMDHGDEVAPAQSRQEEHDADDFGIRLAKLLGYNKAEVFKFLHKQKSEYDYIEALSKSPNSTHPTYQQRINKARLNGFQLSQGGIQQMQTLTSHLA